MGQTDRQTADWYLTTWENEWNDEHARLNVDKQVNASAFKVSNSVCIYVVRIKSLFCRYNKYCISQYARTFVKLVM